MSKSSYSWLMQQSKPANRWLFFSIILGVAAGISVIIQSALLAKIIDHVYLQHASRALLMPLLWSLLLIILLRAVIHFAREMISFHSATMVKETVRKNIFTHLLSLSPQQLASYKTGALSTTLMEQVEALHDFFSDYLPQMTIAVLLPLIIVIVVFTQNWMTGLILFITAPLIPLMMALIGLQTAKLNQENFRMLSRMSAHFLDQLQGLTTLSLFNRARSQTNTIQTVSEAFREKTMQVLRIAFLSSAALELFATLSIALIAVYLGLSLLGFMHTPISLQSALFILLLAPEFFLPLRQLGTFYHARAKAIGAADEIATVLNTQPPSMNTQKNTTAITTPNVKHPVAMTLKNICFAYDNQPIILEHFDLFIPPHECVAIIGPSGSGKSTLLYLIAKLLTPNDGTIFANDLDIQTIENDYWRSHIGFLHQNPRLFYGSILENIGLGNANASRQDIESAAEKAGVMEFIHTLPDQFNTCIHENNAGLSGGQIQRIALARIILKDAPIILLDEPTAYLDIENKKIILDLLAQWRGKKTVIIATHDESLTAITVNI